MFVVVAYRWGWTNSEWYVVNACPDELTAMAFAEAECHSRGGKYGVAVEKQPDGEIVGYFASSYGEDKPTFNRRISAAERIGMRVLDAVHDGETLLPVEGENYCKTQPVQAPEWMHKQVAEIEAIEAILWPDDPAREQAAVWKRLQSLVGQFTLPELEMIGDTIACKRTCHGFAVVCDGNREFGELVVQVLTALAARPDEQSIAVAETSK